MPWNLKLVDCFMTILFILMFNLYLTLVRWNTINFVLSIYDLNVKVVSSEKRVKLHL